MRNWPGQKHHPGIFEEFFPLILERLIEPGSVLTLFVYDWGTEGYFDPTQHVETQLKPRGLPYIYLPSNDVAQPGSLVAPEYLVFEWPLESLNYILEEHWLYSGPFVQTEGYVSNAPLLGLITRLFSQPNTENRIRELLRSTEFCFRAWPDGDAVLLLTDKLDLDSLNYRLKLDELNPLIQEATLHYQGQP